MEGSKRKYTKEEKIHALEFLHQNDNNFSLTSKLLNIHRNTLVLWQEKYKDELVLPKTDKGCKLAEKLETKYFESKVSLSDKVYKMQLEALDLLQQAMRETPTVGKLDVVLRLLLDYAPIQGNQGQSVSGNNTFNYYNLSNNSQINNLYDEARENLPEWDEPESA